MKRIVSSLIPIIIGIFLLSTIAISKSKAQASNTIFQQLAKNLNTFPFTSATVRNIGQSQHIIYVQANNVAGHTCLPHVADITINASYDTVNYFPLSAGTVHGLFGAPGTAENRTGILFATGLAPSVRAQVNSFDNVNCTLNIFYAGSLYPVYLDKMENTLSAQGLRGARFERNLAGTYTLIPRSPTHSTDAISLYGLICNTEAVDTLVFTVGTFADSTIETETFYLPANGFMTITPTGIPWIIIQPMFDFTITISGAGHVNCWYQWRYE